ncbi:Uncharacterised protein [Mycobacteroides abscessus subsp. bolletii]|uniref:hypothetical protein n=1 Tax=Mycobacteroides abscessus TaxID=36809 RepID=UPI0009A8605F|nr:hypothetical protein [Mycobacteroides abscessus]SKR94459.1 Uncharacterised protein [Mycobacteroides abscessus subsp. bolletii]SKS03147.1 Uncharacterised protein [Mycobacteroides abscessus subsp. bolletii]DAZ90095.1 TPA_asm: hypothetical protein PROPHIFVLQ01-1_8 [Mycobacterium phage prophiFVLQ01-1]
MATHFRTYPSGTIAYWVCPRNDNHVSVLLRDANGWNVSGVAERGRFTMFMEPQKLALALLAGHPIPVISDEDLHELQHEIDEPMVFTFVHIPTAPLLTDEDEEVAEHA